MGSRTHENRYRWIVLILFFFIQTIASMAVFSFGPLAPSLQENLHISRAQVGLFASAIYFGMMAFSTHAGWLTDRFSLKLFLVGGPAFMGLLFVALAASRAYLLSLGIVFLVGVGYQFITPTTIKGLLFWFPSRLRGTVIGLKQAGVSFGGALVAGILPWVILSVGWRGAIVFIGLLILVSTAISALCYKNPPDAKGVQGTSLEREPTRIRDVLKNRSLVLLGGCGFVYGIAATSFHTYLIIYLEESLEIQPVMAGSLLAFGQLGVMAGRFFWGVISDRVLAGSRKASMVLIGCAISGFSLMTLFALPLVPVWSMYAILVCFGFSMGFNGVYLTFAAELERNMAGTSIGFSTAICALGIVLGTPVFGFIVDQTGSYGPAWIYLAVLGAVGVVLAASIRETWPRDHATP